MAFKLASAADMLVARQIFCAIAVERIRISSALDSWVAGVLMRKWISLLFRVKMRLLCYMKHIQTRMARSESGRVVIEIDPQTKRKLYANLALSGNTLKDWFASVAEGYCE